MKTAKKARKAKSSAEDLAVKRKQSAFKRKIRSTFVDAGFKYIPTNGHEMVIGLRKIEVDALFIYENIWLICEDTTTTAGIRDHIRTKNEAAKEIIDHFSDYKIKLMKLFPDNVDVLDKYEVERIKIFNLYIPLTEVQLSNDDYQLFNHLQFVQPKTLEYLQWITKCIKFSARNEIFRFLNIQTEDIGILTSSRGSNAEINAPIIYPKEFTGLKNHVRLVSFMMSAEDLLNTAYVMRKDNWEESIWLYQRLIEKSKIKNIRAYVEKKGAAFFNNIIVGLPDNVSFVDTSGKSKTIDELTSFEGNCQLILPKKMNSVCVIDGQHRIYAHYESGVDSPQERKISQLRKQLHLLVTGLVFPKDMKPEVRAQIQSEIFLDINSNTKPVPPNVLLQIKRIKNPIADESVAQFVIEELNREGVFRNMLQTSSLETGKIKTASIVKFALRYLVTPTPVDNKLSLFSFWDGDKEGFFNSDDSTIQEYISFCSNVLRHYFSAVKKNYSAAWNDETAKLLSVTAINGFIIALTRQLSINGINEFEYYDDIFNKWNMDFSKESFSFTSSQYRKFSSKILEEAFLLPIDALDEV